MISAVLATCFTTARELDYCSPDYLDYHYQGGRTWQPFVGGKNGHEHFCQARIYNFRDKCVVFARNLKFSNLTQQNMHYIPCNNALLAHEALFLPKKALFLPKDLQKSA